MSNEKIESPFLSFNEYAAILRTTRANLYNWISAGTVPPTFKIGNRNYIRREVVENFLSERECA